MKTLLNQLRRHCAGNRFHFRLLRPLALCALCCVSPVAARAGSPPVVANVSAAQRPSTDPHPKFVDIFYTLSDPDSTFVNVSVIVSEDSGATWTVPAKTFTSDSPVGTVSVTATPTLKIITWDAGTDWDGHYTTHCRVRVLANDGGLVLIPFGGYQRGNFVASQGSGDADITDAPPYSVVVSAFLMDRTLVTGGMWYLVRDRYADSHGYTFENPGSFKASNHPVQTVNWLDAVKWCNARSEMEGATPVYYTSATYATVLKTGTAGSTTPFVKPGANGYRLPTEAEWEKAARGGTNSLRFPNADVLTAYSANYYGDPADFPYDIGANGYSSEWATGSFPYTSTVDLDLYHIGYENGYHLHDMAGNVFEWCWDRYGASYYAAGQTDPQGPSSGSNRVMRGGSWDSYASLARCANRFSTSPAFASSNRGFRCVKGL